VHHAVLGAKYKGFSPLLLDSRGLACNPFQSSWKWQFSSLPLCGSEYAGGIGDPQILGYCAGNKRAMAQ